MCNTFPNVSVNSQCFRERYNTGLDFLNVTFKWRINPGKSILYMFSIHIIGFYFSPGSWGRRNINAQRVFTKAMRHLGLFYWRIKAAWKRNKFSKEQSVGQKLLDMAIRYKVLRASLLLADDVVQLASSDTDLHLALRRFAARCEVAKKISTSKSSGREGWTAHSRSLLQVDELKYLGVEIDRYGFSRTNTD